MTNSEEAIQAKSSLEQWNHLNKGNAEQDFISSMFKSTVETTGIIDRFSLWLLAGTGATSALLITQVNSVLPHLSQSGFRVCVVILAMSGACGFIAKYNAIRCEMHNSINVQLRALLTPVLDHHEREEEKIKKLAEEDGTVLETEINLTRVMNGFLEPFPRWIKLLISLKQRKSSNPRQQGYHLAIKYYLSQTNWTVLQAMLFLAFLLAGALFAKGG